jgi:hypothetical protein
MLSKIKYYTFVHIVSFLLLVAQDREDGQSNKWMTLVQSVQDVLAGKPIRHMNITISPGAYVAFGNKYENMESIITGKSKTCSLKEDSTQSAVRVVVKVNDSENAAFVTLKTQTNQKTNERYHTVVFMKDSTGVWSIETWSVSN